MSFLTGLFGKSKEKKAEVEHKESPEKKPAPTGTVLRQPKEETPLTEKKKGPELTALEIAEQKGWEVKSLPVWEPGDVILDTYEVEKVISGGMGHVYIANHKRWKRKLAIKSPNEMMLSQKEHFARILREANAWVEMGMHPNVAYCYYVRNIEDVPHIVVEYVDGGDLKEWIEDGKCIDYRVNLDLAIQFCHGMKFAHSKGMIHRDIKPANVLMTKDGILKITDFGLVREQEAGVRGQDSVGRDQGSGGRDQEAGKLTTIGTQMGTAGYMSPEQYANPHDVDERTDIFAFGVCLFEMFCGNRPYEITFGARQEPPDPITLSGDENFPLELTEVLKRSVQWDVSGRYGSFEEIRQELSQIHKKLYKEDSPYAKLELVDLEADGLNNLGVSYFELGRKEDSVSCWEKALEINQTHLEATYNLSLINWRDGEITDDEVLIRLENCGNNPLTDKEKLAELKAAVHAERFDSDAAIDVLKDSPGKYNEVFSEKDIGNIRCVRTMMGHTNDVYSVAVTPDGRYAVSGSWDNTLRLWDMETGLGLRTMGHTEHVHSVALTSDGRYAVSGSGTNLRYGDRSGGILHLWELETGQCVRTMKGSIADSPSFAVTPDSRYAVSGSLDTTLLLWDLETGRCIRTMEGHTWHVLSVAVTSDGRYAVSGSWDKTLRVWELKKGRCVRTMKGHTDAVRSVALTSDGRYAVSGSRDKTLLLWNLETGQCIRTMEGHIFDVLSVAVTPDSRYAVSGSKDKTIRLWELETGQCVRTMEGHTGGVLSVAVTPDGRYAVSGSEDKTILLWELRFDKSYQSEITLSFPKGFQQRKEEEKLLKQKILKSQELYNESDYSKSLAILFEAWEDTGFTKIDDINKLYSELFKKARVTGLRFYFQKRIMEGHTASVDSVALTSDGRYVVSGSSDFTLRLWELETGQCVRTMEGHDYYVNSVALTSDGRYAVSGSESKDKTIRLWELETGQCVRTMEGHTYGVGSIAVTPDGRYAVSGSWDFTLRLWELETGQCVRTMEGHTHFVNSVALTPDGRYAVSGSESKDKTIRLWELETGQCVHTMEGHTGGVLSVAVTSDGRYVVSGSADMTLRLWELETGQCVRTMEGHTHFVNSVALTPDGRYAVSGSESKDKTIRLWELETGQCVHTMEGHTGGVLSVAVTSDGRYVVSGSADMTLRLWELIWDLEFD